MKMGKICKRQKERETGMHMQTVGKTDGRTSRNTDIQTIGRTNKQTER